ncbi:Histone-lysine N-methyltransferase [Phytophthora cinnamomi]|uniref:Histone-lysine N-methyltransferase n=1 Tax=Phytophthora cinnamomi TaxID=4785 RepID=UPI00355A1763|nr:Histone-lysine N-methyltransferase [Phytophthora cinnamomi]
MKHRPAPFEANAPPNLKLMNNSERGKYYRRRRQLYGADLERRVAELREEIAALTVSRQVQQELALSQRRTPLGAAAHVVSEYCSLFSHGAPVRLAVDEQQASASLVAQSTNAQRGFLSAVMNGNVRFGEFLGVELLLDQWERYSLYHAAIQWTMKSLSIVQLAEPRVVDEANQHDDGPLVVSITADLRVRFSRRTIEEVFPHLVGDEALTQSLIGLEVTYPCVNHFHFDERGKIEWYAPEVDFVGALMKALKSPALVARVMGHALIAKDHMIGDESDGRQLAVVEEVQPAAESAGSDSPTWSEDSLGVAEDGQLDQTGRVASGVEKTSAWPS